MKFFKRLIVLLIVYRLAAVSTFGIVTWYYKINLLENPDLQLYGGIGSGILSLLIGLLLVVVKKKKKPAKTVRNETGKKIETASVITPGDDNGLMVDEIPQQPDLPEMPEPEPLEEEETAEYEPEPDYVEEAAEEPEPVYAEEAEPEYTEEVIEETDLDIPVVPEPVIPEDKKELVIEEPVFEEETVVQPEDEVVDFVTTTQTMSVISPEEEAENALTETAENRLADRFSKTFVGDSTPVTEEKKGTEEVKKIFVDDTTQIISTASLNDYLKRIRENRDTEVANASVSKNDIILPLGPREAVVEENIPAEEVVVDETPVIDVVKEAEISVAEMQPQQEEMILRPLEEKEDKTEALSKTQEQYITQSTLSYIDESGKPQFRVTEEIKTVREQDESQKKGFEGFDVRAERAEKWANFLNAIITILVFALVLLLIYYLYNKFFA